MHTLISNLIIIVVVVIVIALGSFEKSVGRRQECVMNRGKEGACARESVSAIVDLGGGGDVDALKRAPVIFSPPVILSFCEFRHSRE